MVSQCASSSCHALVSLRYYHPVQIVAKTSLHFDVYCDRLKGYSSFVWITIEQSVMVSGIVYIFLGFVVVIGHVQLSLLIMGAPLGSRQL